MCRSFYRNYVLPFFDFAPIPKYLICKNTRLGLIYRLMQLLALVGAISQIYLLRAWETKVQPTAHDGIAVWRDTGDLVRSELEEGVKHCANPGAYDYGYNLDFRYRPIRCRSLPIGDSYLKAGNNLYFPTYIKEATVWEGVEPQCHDAARRACQYNLQGTWTYSTGASTGATCKCDSEEEYFTKNPETLHRLSFHHGYQVKNGDIVRRGKSNMIQYEEVSPSGIASKNGRIRTVILGFDGKACPVVGMDGQRRSEFNDLDAISATLQDWLRCAGISLDSTVSVDANETEEPYIRLTGVVLQLQLDYDNPDDDLLGIFLGYDDSDRNVRCTITVTAEPKWTTRLIFTNMQLPSPVTSDIATFTRYMSGIDVKVMVGGGFVFFDIASLFNAIISSIVLMGLPATIIPFIALYCVGLISKVYYSASYEEFQIGAKLCGVTARMTSYAASFRGLTDQWQARAKSMEAMPGTKLAKHIRDVFYPSVVNGTLSTVELNSLCTYIKRSFDKSGEGGVDFSEYIQGCTENEPIDMHDIAKLFDVDRRPSRLERLLNDKPFVAPVAPPGRVAELEGDFSKDNNPAVAPVPNSYWEDAYGPPADAEGDAPATSNLAISDAPREVAVDNRGDTAVPAKDNKETGVAPLMAEIKGDPDRRKFDI